VKLHLTTLLGIALLVPACSRNEPRSTQAAEERTNATDQMKAERDQYVKDMDARLDEFDKKIDGLNDRASAMTGAAKTSFKDNIDRLSDQRKEVAKKLDDLKSVNIESWTTLRGEVDSAMAGLDRSYEQMSNMIDKATPATSPNQKYH
jgi:chromosome segregation ATPase